MAQDPTLIDPSISLKYKNPLQNCRDIDQRKQNITGGYVYDLLLPEFGDKFSLPNGNYELLLNSEKYFMVFDSNKKWTGYAIDMILWDNGQKTIPTKPLKSSFIDGNFSIKLSKKQQTKIIYTFTLIDNTYPKYSSQEKTPTITASATVIDSKTGKPIKAKAN